MTIENFKKHYSREKATKQELEEAKAVIERNLANAKPHRKESLKARLDILDELLGSTNNKKSK